MRLPHRPLSSAKHSQVMLMLQLDCIVHHDDLATTAEAYVTCVASNNSIAQHGTASHSTAACVLLSQHLRASHLFLASACAASFSISSAGLSSS
jgi:hypothetical protein